MLRLINVLLSFTAFAGVMACCCPCGPMFRGGGPPIQINVPPPQPQPVQPVNPGDGVAVDGKKKKKDGAVKDENKSKDDDNKDKTAPNDDIPVTPEAMLKKFPLGGVVYTYSPETREFKLEKQVLGKGTGGFAPGRYTMTERKRNQQGGLGPRDQIQLSPPSGKGFYYIMPDDIQYKSTVKVIRLPRNVWEAIVEHGNSVLDVLPP